jgi:dCMP deaminase
MSQLSWDKFFMGLADYVSRKSKDRSTKVGAVLVTKDHRVLGVGWNGFPRGVNDDVDIRHERPLKYLLSEHAERNSIFNAAADGIRVSGATIYMSKSGAPCADCARAIIQSGIREVVSRAGKFEGKGGQWEESCNVGLEMLKEAGIRVTFLDKRLRRMP